MTTEAIVHAEAQACAHHWLIEPANGPQSLGTCRRCGRQREFFNDPQQAQIQPPQAG
jgi:hypothetical protein